MDKRSLTERDICTKFILPAVRSAGWDEMVQVREEVFFTKGRIFVRGKLVTRGKAKKADFVVRVPSLCKDTVNHSSHYRRRCHRYSEPCPDRCGAACCLIEGSGLGDASRSRLACVGDGVPGHRHSYRTAKK